MTSLGKELLDVGEIGDVAAVQLSDLLANVAARHLLPQEVYVMMTSPLGLEGDVFTRPYAVNQNQSGDMPELSTVEAFSDVGHLKPNISIAEHIELVASQHPGTAFILDQETAIGLSKDPSKSVTLIDYGDDHCLLTGLNVRGIDVFLTCPMTVIRGVPGLTIVKFKP